MKAAKVFVASLEAAGVQYVFGVPGEENLAFVEALRESQIQLVTTRDEQAAVFMAATVGRLTGRVGVALSTLGPGATNLVTGVAYAQLGGMPLMVITGQKPIKKSKQGKFQIIDVVGMMQPLTKSAETIVAADRIPTTVYQAVRTAESERPGAVHIELPEDVAEEETDLQPIEWRKIRRPVPDEKSISQLLELVQAASKPVIVIGSGANRKLIGNQLKNFIDKTKIPFVSTQMGKGVVDEGSELYLGTAALSSGDFVHQALQVADLIIMVGHDTTEKPPVIAGAHHKIAHLNFYPAELDEVYQPTLEVIGDISHALWALSERIQAKNYWLPEELKHLRDQQLNDTLTETDSNAFPVKPQRFVNDLRQSLPRDAILSLDNGMFKIWLARNYPAYQQNTVLLDNALATMGAGLGVGTAAKLLNPDKPVIVVAGDGGVMMNIADLETVVRLKLDMVVIIVNDNGYGMIKWKQASMGLTDYGLSFNNPDFVQLAGSFGAKGHRVTTAADFQPILKQALQAGGVHIIDLPIDYSENATLTATGLQKRLRTRQAHQANQAN